MKDAELMQIAIDEAKKSKEWLKCGAVIVKNGVLVSKSENFTTAARDSSAHAEINVIRLAGQKLGTKVLEGCEIYATCEPCIMCLSAIGYSRIEKVFYGASLREVSPKEKIIDFSIEEFLQRSPFKFEVEQFM
ncbi:MAG: nucleoside deaminase, partial [Candidatus Micrarchaeota archaeon]|nr:nucleoside deaminase [Candidatus Micrarchaeota archaeon]